MFNPQFDRTCGITVEKADNLSLISKTNPTARHSRMQKSQNPPSNAKKKP